MVSTQRAERIAERIREELSEILIYDSSDPRLSGIFVTEVLVDRELAYANIYVSAVEGISRAEEIIAALQHAKGYLRFELSQRIELRTFPDLRFHWDPTLEKAERIEKIITQIHQEEDQDPEITRDQDIDAAEETNE